MYETDKNYMTKLEKKGIELADEFSNLECIDNRNYGNVVLKFLNGGRKMEIFTLLESLEEILESGSKVPFSSKVMVDIDELRDILEDIRLKLPDELKQAKWVKEERQRIIEDAQKEADNIIQNAESKIVTMIDENAITKKP